MPPPSPPASLRRRPGQGPSRENTNLIPGFDQDLTSDISHRARKSTEQDRVCRNGSDTPSDSTSVPTRLVQADPDDTSHKYSRSRPRRSDHSSSDFDPIQSISGLIESVSAYLDGEPSWGIKPEPTLFESHQARVQQIQRQQFLERSFNEIRNENHRQKGPANNVSGRDCGPAGWGDSPSLIDSGNVTASINPGPPSPFESVDEDLLAYIHPVAQADTLTGISIRYGCSIPAIRKTNRLWPNDVPQVRSFLVLPFSACSVRGTPSGRNGDQLTDLLTEDSPMTPPKSGGTNSGGGPVMNKAPAALDKRSNSFNNMGTLPQVPEQAAWPDFSNGPGNSTQDDEEEGSFPWTHHSWVTLPGTDLNLEVVRLPEKDFVYYPPARRKTTTVAAASPEPAFFNSRTSSAGTTTHTQLNSPPSRRRRISQVPPSQRAFLGTPGVGPLDGESAKCPGAPANDPLTRLWEKHFPDMIPPASSVLAMTRLAAANRPSAAAERARAWSSVSAASAVSALSDTSPSRTGLRAGRVYGAYPSSSGGGGESGVKGILGMGLGGSQAVVSKGLDWIKRMTERAAGSMANSNGSSSGEGNDIALFSWLGEHGNSGVSGNGSENNSNATLGSVNSGSGSRPRPPDERRKAANGEPFPRTSVREVDGGGGVKKRQTAASTSASASSGAAVNNTGGSTRPSARPSARPSSSASTPTARFVPVASGTVPEPENRPGYSRATSLGMGMRAKSAGAAAAGSRSGPGSGPAWYSDLIELVDGSLSFERRTRG